MSTAERAVSPKANRPALRLVKTNDLSREDWLDVRKSGIGSSDAAAVGLEEAITEARQLNERRKSIGYDQAALDASAKQGFGNGAFEESEDEIPQIVTEFYFEDGGNIATDGGHCVPVAPTKSSLREKLDRKAAIQLGESE